MAETIVIRSIHFARIFTIIALVAGSFLTEGIASEEPKEPKAQSNLVRVQIVTRTHGEKVTVEINGKLVDDYRPIIKQYFSSTGIVLDGKDHVMTFLGYRWLDIQSHDPQINVVDSEGRKWKAKLVGIDQNNGAAVVKLTEGKLQKTPTCTECEVKDGTKVMAPVPNSSGRAQFRESQIISVGSGAELPEDGSWVMKVSRPFPDIGQPVLTTDHRVIGFIASQDSMGMTNIVYPISNLLASAEKILKKGGDIHAGWLGVFLLDAHLDKRSGVMIERIDPDSPAQKAGLSPKDLLVKFNGKAVNDSRQFINLVQNAPIGSEAIIEIVRQGKLMTVASQVETRRQSSNTGLMSFNFPGESGNPRGMIGLDAILLNPALADAIDLAGKAGLLIVDVAKDMPAESAGVLPGDVIVLIDGQPIVDAPGFTTYLLERDWNTPVVLQLLRKGIERTITIQLKKQKSELRMQNSPAPSFI